MTSRKLLLTLALVAAVLAAQTGVVDESGREYTERGFKRALVAFAAARTLNGVISVAQGTEVAFEPVGIGVTLTPGELLDPINDLIERFSWVVLASGTVLGVQRVLLTAIAWPPFSLAISAIVLGGAALLWVGSGPLAGARSPWLRLSAGLLVIRFAVPVMALSSEAFHDAFLAPQHEAAARQLADTTQSLRALSEPEAPGAPGDESFVERMQRAYRSTNAALDVDARLAALEQAAERLSEQVVTLIVSFVIQTLLFPLAFLWLGLRLLRALARGPRAARP